MLHTAHIKQMGMWYTIRKRRSKFLIKVSYHICPYPSPQTVKAARKSSP